MYSSRPRETSPNVLNAKMVKRKKKKEVTDKLQGETTKVPWSFRLREKFVVALGIVSRGAGIQQEGRKKG